LSSLKFPSEILEEHPQIKKVWSARYLGYLFMLELVDGKKTRRSCKLNVDDVLRQFGNRIIT